MEKQIAKCHHCGNTTQQNILFTVDSEDEAYSVQNPSYTERYEITYILVQCETCMEVSLHISSIYYGDNGDLDHTSIAYPQVKRFEGVPKNVLDNYNEARKVEKISGTAFAIMIRRALECLCLDQEATGRNLKLKIDDLAQRNIIPPTLAEMGHQLRFLGNVGAHNTENKIDLLEIQAINDFFSAMLEFVYVAPSKLKNLKEAIERKYT